MYEFFLIGLAISRPADSNQEPGSEIQDHDAVAIDQDIRDNVYKLEHPKPAVGCC